MLTGGTRRYLESAGARSYLTSVVSFFIRRNISWFGSFHDMKGRGSHSFLDVERELINAEVLSGRIDGPLCLPLIDTHCQFGPCVILLISAG